MLIPNPGLIPNLELIYPLFFRFPDFAGFWGSRAGARGPLFAATQLLILTWTGVWSAWECCTSPEHVPAGRSSALLHTGDTTARVSN